MEQNTIELYGVIGKVEYLHAHGVSVTLIEDETNIEWEVVIVDKWVDSDYLKEGFHVVAGGRKGYAKNQIFADYFERWGRYCNHCGKHHVEGFWINEHSYACSEECAIALLGGKKEFDDAMAEYDDYADCNPICWVLWE